MSAGVHNARPRSLRRRLTFTYAGIALLTAAVLGGILVVVLSAHFSSVDEANLQGAALRAARNLGTTQSSSLEQVLRLTAYGTNTRVQVLGSAHQVIADSGSPQKITGAALGAPSAAGQGQQAGGGDATAPVAAAPPRTDETRSAQVYVRAALPGSPAGVAFIRVSEGPSSGGSLMGSVIVAWAVAAVAAVIAAALAGSLISSRIARPLAQLAAASDRMAAGDLGTRAEVAGSDEIGRLAHSFNDMASQVEGTVTALRRFVSDAAHQLGTPLTALRTDLEMLQDTAGGEGDRRRLDRALAQEQRLEALGSGLLQLSRLESPDASRPVRPVDLAGLLEAAADAVSSRVEQAGLDLEVAVPDAPVMAVADPDRLRTAVENLVDNAIKFTPPDGHVRCGVRAEDGSALIWVADDGPGIPVADRERVFERFYRAPGTADRPGSGLGLAIVRAAAKASGGSVRVAPSDAGTRMEIRLPLPPLSA